jgi:multidrug resistance efflux pump
MEATLATAVAFPKFRSDLQVSEQRTRNATVYVLKEPASGRIFRLPETAYFIARQLDGRTAPEDICRRVVEKFGEPLAADAFDSFLADLRKLGLVEDVTAGPRPGPAPRGRIRGDLLYLRLKAFDPDAALDRLLPKVRLCFTAGFVWFSAALFLLAVCVAVTDWPDIRQELGGLARFHALVYAWAILLATVSVHEFAHGLTCKHFGGHVHEMGFMLIYFQPAFYCNVTDAWLFPDKAKRLWVTVAGAFVNTLMWALGVLVWRLTEVDTWIHFTALVVVATTSIRTLFNLNPLIKLDGYYLLSDALDMPNLRVRAMTYLRAVWRRLWNATGTVADTPSARERRIYLAYGLLAGAYSSSLLGTIAWWAGSRLVDRYQGLGFVLFVGLLTMFFRNPIKRSLAKLPEGLRAGPRWFRSLKPSIRVFAAMGVALIALVVIPATLTVSGEFTVLPIENADVRAEVEGTISEVYVSEGGVVQAGTPIARLSDREIRTELSETEASIRERQARHKQLQAGPRREDIALSRQRVATAKTRVTQAQKRYAEAQGLHTARRAGAHAAVDRASEQLKFAQQTLERIRPLVDQGFLPRARLEDAQTEVSIRSKALEETRATLQMVQADDLAQYTQEIAMAQAESLEAEREHALLLAGSRPEDIEATQAEIANLEARRDFLLGQIDRMLIRSPHPGVITTPRMEQKVGQHVAKGDLIAEVHERKQVMAEIAVREREIGPVRLGQTVFIKARAHPYTTFKGMVTRIAPATEASEIPAASGIVRVTTVIDNAEQLLTTGMTGFAKIECGKRSLITVLGRNLFGVVSVEVWSWW